MSQYFCIRGAWRFVYMQFKIPSSLNSPKTEHISRKLLYLRLNFSHEMNVKMFRELEKGEVYLERVLFARARLALS